jgi:hypothetical protein
MSYVVDGFNESNAEQSANFDQITKTTHPYSIDLTQMQVGRSYNLIGHTPQ